MLIFSKKSSIHISWKFPRLAENSPKNIFSYECIFPAEWDIFFLRSRCTKMLRNHTIHCNIFIIILLFYFQENIIKLLRCIWISSRCRTPSKRMIKVSSPKFLRKTGDQIRLLLVYTWTRGNIFFSVNRDNTGKSIFIWTAPY